VEPTLRASWLLLLLLLLMRLHPLVLQKEAVEPARQEK
jgi:hypothetical protein